MGTGEGGHHRRTETAGVGAGAVRPRACGDTPLAGGGITGADLGNTVTSYGTGGEWNVSFAIGCDFRRR